MMGEHMRIDVYFDMDGVPAVYGFGDTVEQMKRPGYFANRPAQENVIQLVKQLLTDDHFAVHFLSAVFDDEHSVWDKRLWLEHHGLSEVDTIFVPCGANKALYIKPGQLNVLVDDYTDNLMNWENQGANYLGVKFDNGGNGRKGTWRRRGGLSLSCDLTAEEMYRGICVMCMMQSAVA